MTRTVKEQSLMFAVQGAAHVALLHCLEALSGSTVPTRKMPGCVGAVGVAFLGDRHGEEPSHQAGLCRAPRTSWHTCTACFDALATFAELLHRPRCCLTHPFEAGCCSLS